MQEPTHRQHLILEGLKSGKISDKRNSSDSDIELFWELVRTGYINNFALLGSFYDWRFSLTNKAEEYLNSFKNN